MYTSLYGRIASARKLAQLSCPVDGTNCFVLLAGGSTDSRPLQWCIPLNGVLSNIRGFGRLIAAPTDAVCCTNV